MPELTTLKDHSKFNLPFWSASVTRGVALGIACYGFATLWLFYRANAISAVNTRVAAVLLILTIILMCVTNFVIPRFVVRRLPVTAAATPEVRHSISVAAAYEEKGERETRKVALAGSTAITALLLFMFTAFTLADEAAVEGSRLYQIPYDQAVNVDLPPGMKLQSVESGYRPSMSEHYAPRYFYRPAQPGETPQSITIPCPWAPKAPLVVREHPAENVPELEDSH